MFTVQVPREGRSSLCQQVEDFLPANDNFCSNLSSVVGSSGFFLQHFLCSVGLSLLFLGWMFKTDISLFFRRREGFERAPPQIAVVLVCYLLNSAPKIHAIHFHLKFSPSSGLLF